MNSHNLPVEGIWRIQKIWNAVGKYRKAAGFSQAQVAEMMGLSNDAISRMERGNISLNVSRLFEFAELFGCQAADFVLLASPRVDDQTLYLSQLLHRLTPEERKGLLSVMERLVSWKTED